MTVPMTTGTERHAAAVRFGTELSRAMTRRGVGQRTLGDAAKVSRASIVAFRHGQNLPTTPVARRLAEALEWPSLAAIVEEARRGSCAVCRAPIRLDTGTRRLYCSIPCRNIAGDLARPAERQRSAATQLASFKASLELHRGAVVTMCSGCEPEGTCRDAGCPLRPVSPLPLETDAVDAEVAVKAPGRWGHPGEREAWSAYMRQQHASGAMGDARARSLALWANRTPEERAEVGRRISAGRRGAA